MILSRRSKSPRLCEFLYRRLHYRHHRHCPLMDRVATLYMLICVIISNISELEMIPLVEVI